MTTTKAVLVPQDFAEALFAVNKVDMNAWITQDNIRPVNKPFALLPESYVSKSKNTIEVREGPISAAWKEFQMRHGVTMENLPAISIAAAASSSSSSERFTLKSLAAHIDNWSDYNIFPFQGFSPERFEEILNTVAEKHKLSKDQVAEDLRFMVAYAMQRGTSIATKGESRSTKPAAEKAKDLVARWSIANKKGTNDDAITLGRVCASIPLTCLDFLESTGTKGAATPGIIPRIYMFPAAASLMPQAQQYHKYWQLFLKWSDTFSDMITTDPKMRKRNRTRTRQIADVAWKSNTVSDADRVELFKKHKESWKSCLPKAEKKKRETEEDEEDETSEEEEN